MATPAFDIHAVICREQDALAAETRISQCPPFVAVDKLEDIVSLPAALHRSHKASLRQMPEARGGGYIIDCPSLQSSVLWVATSNHSYRDDYLQFLNTTYQLNLARIPPPVDVDHFFNRARAQRHGLQFIRLALADHTTHRSHGAAYEKGITRNEALHARRDTGNRYITCVKRHLLPGPGEEKFKMQLSLASCRTRKPVEQRAICVRDERADCQSRIRTNGDFHQ